MKHLRAFIRWKKKALNGRKAIGLLERGGRWHLIASSPGNGWSYFLVPSNIQVTRVIINLTNI